MNPKVSVMSTTYNHERFIAQTVESVLSQETDFPFEMVVGEDCSTDQTRPILRDLQHKYPQSLRLLLREQNWGRRRNFLDTLHTCTGEYTAILDGDDFWIDPKKLQRQADYLDQHSSCALCFHPVYKQLERPPGEDSVAPAPRQPHTPPLVKDTYTAQDLARGNFIATCSVMFRSRLLETLPEWIMDVPAADWPLFMLLAQQGDIGYLPQFMGVYRLHSGGIWSAQSTANRLRSNIRTRETIRPSLNPALIPIVDKQIARTHIRLLRTLLKARDLPGAARQAAAIIFSPHVSRKALLTEGWQKISGRLQHRRPSN